MLFRFLLALGSSWVANPLGIVVAHGLGVSNEPLLIQLLLGVGASAPFQLLLNESFAVRAVKDRRLARPQDVGVICVLQGVCCTGALYVAGGQSDAHTIALGVLLALGTFSSYRSAIIYYGLALNDLISNASSVLVGALPGLVSLAIYTSYGVTRGLGMPAEFLLAGAILPALAQALYLTAISRKRPRIEAARSRPLAFSAALPLGALMLFSFASTQLRDAVAASSVAYAALIIVALNSLTSLTNTVTRAWFLSGGGKSHASRIAAMSIIPAIGSALTITLFPPLGGILALLTTQLLISAVIASARLDRTGAFGDTVGVLRGRA